MIKRFILIFVLVSSIALPLWASVVSWPGQELVHQLNWRGVHEYECNDYTKAAAFFEKSLKLHETIHAPRDLFYSQILHNLATAYFYLGEKHKAEPLFLEGVSLREQYLGCHHPDVAQTLNNLAILYLFDRDYEKAEPLFRRVLEIRKTVFGPEHSETARTLHDLGELYRKKKNYDEALRMHNEALGIRLRTEPGSKFTGASFFHRGEVFQAKHLDEEARSDYRQAFKILRANLGANHIFTKVVAGHLYKLTSGAEGAPCDCDLNHKTA